MAGRPLRRARIALNNSGKAGTRFNPKIPGARYLVLLLDANIAHAANMDIEETSDYSDSFEGEAVTWVNGVGTCSGSGVIVIDTQHPSNNWSRSR